MHTFWNTMLGKIRELLGIFGFQTKKESTTRLPDEQDAPQPVRAEKKNAYWIKEIEEILESKRELIQWARVRNEKGEEQTVSEDALTVKQIVQWIDETLDGQYVYFALDFMLQGEGIYVKRLNKTVFRPFHSTLVLHQSAGNMACLFFAGDSMCCYRLIHDFYAYCEIDSSELRMLPVGETKLTEYIVFQERSKIDEALRILFLDLEYAAERMKGSKRWSILNMFPGVVNNYNKLRREQGLLEE